VTESCESTIEIAHRTPRLRVPARVLAGSGSDGDDQYRHADDDQHADQHGEQADPSALEDGYLPSR
jgi:hypothetical protein